LLVVAVAADIAVAAVVLVDLEPQQHFLY